MTRIPTVISARGAECGLLGANGHTRILTGQIGIALHFNGIADQYAAIQQVPFGLSMKWS